MPSNIELPISQLILGVLGIARKYHLPQVSPPEMNTEIDKAYHTAIKKIEKIYTQKLADAERRGRIDALQELDDYVTYPGRFNKTYGEIKAIRHWLKKEKEQKHIKPSKGKES